jgi:hypothetical protein
MSIRSSEQHNFFNSVLKLLLEVVDVVEGEGGGIVTAVPPDALSSLSISFRICVISTNICCRNSQIGHTACIYNSTVKLLE